VDCGRSSSELLNDDGGVFGDEALASLRRPAPGDFFLMLEDWISYSRVREIANAGSDYRTVARSETQCCVLGFHEMRRQTEVSFRALVAQNDALRRSLSFGRNPVVAAENKDLGGRGMCHQGQLRG
jgi:hypothetical protein